MVTMVMMVAAAGADEELNAGLIAVIAMPACSAVTPFAPMPAMAMAIGPPVHLLKLWPLNFHRLLKRSYRGGVRRCSSEMQRDRSQYRCK